VASPDAGEETSWIEPAPNERLDVVLIEGPLVLSERQRGQTWSVAERRTEAAPDGQ
jgi:hypothetical protein